MDPHDERLMQNEDIFRRVNERLKDLGEAFSVVSERAQFICECADPTCTARVEMTLDEYEAVRAHAACFFMLRGHEHGEIERVVRETDRYVVVQKPRGELADAAAAEDPRDE